MPSLHDLPPEILFEILGEVVAGYIEKAVTSPPIDGWETLDSELHSEWFTDEEDSDGEADGESDGDGLESDASNGHPFDVAASGSTPPVSAFQEGTVYHDVDRGEDPLGVTLLDEDDVMPMWAAEQERNANPQNMLEFKLYLWDVLEEREMLPRNDIAPLLSVSRYVREITLKVLQDSLGAERSVDGSLSRNTWSLLRHLRRHYRLAHTQPFDLPSPDYPIRMTPLVECYYWLADLAYSLRQMRKLIYMEPLDSQQAIYNMLSLSDMADDIPQLVFRPRIDQRVQALLVHMRRFISVSMYCADITCTYKDMFSLKGTARNPGFIIHEEKIPAFTKSIEAFVQFDRKHMDRKKFPELPGPLVDLSGVVKTLSDAKKLKYVAEFRRKEIMSATCEASKLLEKWKLRAGVSSYILLEDS